MINEKFYDEIKENLIENISNTFTLNLAISLWEDSKKYRVDSEYYKQGLIEIREYFNMPEWEEDNSPPTSHHEAKEDILQIIDKFLGDSDV